MRSGNPTLKPFEQSQTWDDLAAGSAGASDKPIATPGTMTVAGTITATGTLVGLCVASAVLAWSRFEPMMAAQNFGPVIGWTIGGLAIGFILGLAMMFKPTTARFVAFPYAVAEGVMLAGITLFVGYQYLSGYNDDGTLAKPEMAGLVTQAIAVTLSIAAGMLAAYGSGLVRLGGFAKKMILTMVMGVAFYYMATLLLGFIGINIGQPIHSSGPLGIGFSAVMVVLASFMLLLDFQHIDEAIKQGNTPKHMEWYAGFAVLSSLVWLYIEVLRLVAKLKAND